MTIPFQKHTIRWLAMMTLALSLLFVGNRAADATCTTHIDGSSIVCTELNPGESGANNNGTSVNGTDNADGVGGNGGNGGDGATGGNGGVGIGGTDLNEIPIAGINYELSSTGGRGGEAGTPTAAMLTVAMEMGAMAPQGIMVAMVARAGTRAMAAQVGMVA